MSIEAVRPVKCPKYQIYSALLKQLQRGLNPSGRASKALSPSRSQRRAKKLACHSSNVFYPSFTCLCTKLRLCSTAALGDNGLGSGVHTQHQTAE